MAGAQWKGAASGAFQGFADGQGRDTDALADLFPKMAQALDVLADEIDTVKARMEQAKVVARQGELTVYTDAIYPPKPFTATAPASLDGRTTAAESKAHADAIAAFEGAKALQAKQEAAFAEAQATVKYARDHERAAHERLVKTLSSCTDGLRGIGQNGAWQRAAAAPTSPAAISLAGTAMNLETHAANATRVTFEQAAAAGPFATQSMWSSLSESQRADMTARFPQLVGNTDGIPALDRHVANMTTLNQQRQALLAKLSDAQRRARKSYGNPSGMNDIAIAEVEQIEETLDGLEQIRSAAEKDGKLLLGLDAVVNGRGQVIIASGNPDTAQHIVTTVPGTYSDVGDAMDYVERGDRIIDKAKQFAPGETFASVTWVDYQSPGTLVNAAEGRFAEDAKGDLSSFQEGLRATHDDTTPDTKRSHNTVIGHSYGSTTVGYASRDNGLHSDDLVFIGSPGVGVETAGELGVPPEHVWSGTSRLDLIDYLTPSPNPIDYLVEEPFDDHQWFGRNPSNEHFGARRLPVDNWAGHGGYWDHPESVDAMAKVVANKTQPTDGVR
ncbi:alpha/beta hydrolase [Saccharopolyspora phatthalungensis]|uniref:DUF1023 domain-containing protein n=1 Tax=Saccharopolyspora phatthalungensis TaxID=664693 RepID=A0A840PZZ2_9PSEU|nr:alpha/beta hydrolase [Saccharopolyspora phatthalungensis]MBB5155852.1 hypothetical protein [Saccharopolyspora phatthalungensis]